MTAEKKHPQNHAPGGAIDLDPSQYNFSYNPVFGQLELEVIDPSILNTYIRLGISVRVYDSLGNVAYNNNFNDLYAGDPNNMAGLLSAVVSGELYNVEFSFLTELGLVIVNETFSF